MGRVLGMVLAVTAASGYAGCADASARQGLTADELVAQLRAIPGVTVDEATTLTPDYRYYVLHVTQPIDHDDPGRGTFQQEVSLLHRDTLEDVPVVIQTSGYADDNLDTPVELTELLAANQVSIEHRYYGASMPEPCDWTRLTIWQMAEDEHAIIAALRAIYGGAFLSTGGSKGGMTAIFHRRFHPDDVAGTVAYVAPLSLGAPDPRYAAFIDGVGEVGCHTLVRDAATEMLAHRRPQMELRAAQQPGYAYTQIELGAAVEGAILGLEWAFWQFHGIAECPTVPLTTASDDELFAFLDAVSPIHDNDDDHVAHAQPYYYQSYSQLGYPDRGTTYLAPFVQYGDDDYAHQLPTQAPSYDPTAMHDIDDYVEHHGDHLLFIYGQWDPWTAGAFRPGSATDTAVLEQAQGTHSSWITTLERSARDAAFAKLAAWTGVTPMASRVRRGIDHADRK
jgi:hypothetical protein